MGSRYRHVSNKIDPFTPRLDYLPFLPLIFSRKAWDHVHPWLEGSQLSETIGVALRLLRHSSQPATSGMSSFKKRRVATSDYDIDNPLQLPHHLLTVTHLLPPSKNNGSFSTLHSLPSPTSPRSSSTETTL